MNEITVFTSSIEAPEYINANLKRATQRVYKIGETVRKCAYETAVIIAAVEASECFKDDGFNSVHEWTEAAFGFKKSASYTLLKIGKEYVRALTNSKTGKVSGYMSNLLPENSEKDFTTTQIEKMLPAGHALAAELVENGEITPDMSCKEISKIIKGYIKDDEDSESKEEENPSDENEADEADTSTVVSMCERDGEVIIDDGVDTWIIPVEVFNKYRVVK